MAVTENHPVSRPRTQPRSPAHTQSDILGKGLIKTKSTSINIIPIKI